MKIGKHSLILSVIAYIWGCQLLWNAAVSSFATECVSIHREELQVGGSSCASDDGECVSIRPIALVSGTKKTRREGNGCNGLFLTTGGMNCLGLSALTTLVTKRAT